MSGGWGERCLVVEVIMFLHNKYVFAFIDELNRWSSFAPLLNSIHYFIYVDTCF